MKAEVFDSFKGFDERYKVSGGEEHEFVDLEVLVCISIDGIGDAHDRSRILSGWFRLFALKLL